MSQFLSVADVRNGRMAEVVLCQNMPIPSTGISFMAGRSLPPWEPIGTLFHTSRRKRKFRKRKYENYPTNRPILPTFFRRVKFLFSLPLLSILFLTRRCRYNYLVRERLYPFFVPKGEGGGFSSFLFFYRRDTSDSRTVHFVEGEMRVRREGKPR